MAKAHDDSDAVVERFHATSGRVTGWLAVVLATVVVVAGLVYLDDGFPDWVIGAAFLMGAVSYTHLTLPTILRV